MGEYIEKNWNRIYFLNRVNIPACCEKNEEIYDSVTSEHYATLVDCVNHAVKMGNHTAFTHFFMKKAKSQKEVFIEVLGSYLDEYDEKRQGKKKLFPTWRNFKIFDSFYWRSYDDVDADYDDQEFEKYRYSKPQLSLWKDATWKPIPSKDAIVQCCLYLGKSVEETNRLLIASGRTQLYELDIVDAVSMYYLKKYEGNFEIEGYEKVKEAKRKINSALKNLLTEDSVSVKGFERIMLNEDALTDEEREILQELSAVWNGNQLSFGKIIYEMDEKGEPAPKLDVSDYIKKTYSIRLYKTYPSGDDDRYYENIRIGNPYLSENHKYAGSYLKWDSKSKHIYRFEKKRGVFIGEKEELGFRIQKDIEKYQHILQQLEENKTHASMTDYLTVLYREKMEQMHVEEYIESGWISDKDWILKQKQYGYLKKTAQYLMEYSSYMKNLKYSSCDFTADKVSIKELKNRDEFIDRRSGKFVKAMDDGKYEISTAQLLKIVNAIGEISDAINGHGNLSSKGKGNFKAKSLIKGRNIVDGEAYQVETAERKAAYEMDLTDKRYSMKYAIATGREDELGRYLKYAGFWKEDLFDLEKLEEDTLQLMTETDFLILYARKYRDALLEKWADNLHVDKVAYMREAKQEFPFIKLLMTINRDIQFVNEKILSSKMENLEDILIYPVNYI